MIKAIRSALLWSLGAVLCILVLNLDSFAAGMGAVAVEVSEINAYKAGPGDHMDERGNIVSLNGEILVDSEGRVLKGHTIADSTDTIGVISDTPVEEPAASAGLNYTVEESGTSKTYTFDGKRYIEGDSYGVHRLTGYSMSDAGTSMTVSGEEARPRYTIAAPEDLPIGTVVIIKGVNGPRASEYDGMYVVQDRGGDIIEENKYIDIYFDTYEEAMLVTDQGWNEVEVVIAVPLE